MRRIDMTKKSAAVTAVLFISAALCLTGCEGKLANGANEAAANCWDCTSEVAGSEEASGCFDSVDCSVCVLCYGEGISQCVVTECTSGCGEFCHGQSGNYDRDPSSEQVLSSSYSITERAMRGTNEFNEVCVALDFKLDSIHNYDSVTVHAKLILPDGRYIVSTKTAEIYQNSGNEFSPEFEFYVENDRSNTSPSQKYGFEYLIHGNVR